MVGDGTLRWGDLDIADGEETIAIEADRMEGGRELHGPIHLELCGLREGRAGLA